jgi:pimeloyl-ACP methyl ester carboxylesterase
MFEELAALATNHPNIIWRKRFADLVVEIVSDDESYFLSFGDDGITLSQTPAGRRADIILSASEAIWRELRSPAPGPGRQSLSAMRRTGHMTVGGDHDAFYRHLMMLELLFSMSRERAAKSVPEQQEPVIEAVTGRYLRLQFEGRPHRIYFEEAGEGIPLICLHTAGADGRQYRALLNDPAVTSRFRVVVFDLPWHGKSSPPPGFENEIYRLTTDRYVGITIAVKQALGLDNPVIMGCSIGGRAVLHLALRHGAELRAVIGLQSALYAENKIDGEPDDLRPLHRPDIHGQECAAALMTGLIAPQSNSTDAWETLWHYMQGGPGIFMGDLHYYFNDGDLRNGMAEGIDTRQCPVYLLSGDYDTSATPEMGQELADLIGATYFEVMKNMGHFPMSENPDEFRSYLLPVLQAILEQPGTTGAERNPHA